MDIAGSIHCETPKGETIVNSKIEFIEELIFKYKNEEYKIQYGIKENNKEVVFKVSSNQINFCYYQHSYIVGDFHQLSNAFQIYQTAKEIISFLKKAKFEIAIKNKELLLKYNILDLNGNIKLIELSLPQHIIDDKNMVKYLIEEIKSIQINTKKEISNLKQKHELEIKKLQQNISNYQNEIANLKTDMISNQQALFNSKEENKKLSKEIINLKKTTEQFILYEKTKINFFDSRTIGSFNSIDFILNYIRQNDPLFNFTMIQLLYRGSRDGDSTQTCHELCDNKQNVLIVMKSDTNYVFGGYSKIGFKTNNNINNGEYLIDNNCFLFSLNLKKIYPVINNQKIICNLINKYGLCFDLSLAFFDNFMHVNENVIYSKIKRKFNGINNEYEMNGGRDKFQCKELEVFQLL